MDEPILIDHHRVPSSSINNHPQLSLPLSLPISYHFSTIGWLFLLYLDPFGPRLHSITLRAQLCSSLRQAIGVHRFWTWWTDVGGNMEPTQMLLGLAKLQWGSSQISKRKVQKSIFSNISTSSEIYICIYLIGCRIRGKDIQMPIIIQWCTCCSGDTKLLCRILARTIHKDLRYPVAFFFQKGSFKIVGKVFKVIQSHGCNQRPLFGTASRTLSVAKEGPSACAEGVGQGFGSSGNRIDSVLIDIILLLRKLWGKLCTQNLGISKIVSNGPIGPTGWGW